MNCFQGKLLLETQIPAQARPVKKNAKGDVRKRRKELRIPGKKNGLRLGVTAGDFLPREQTGRREE